MSDSDPMGSSASLLTTNTTSSSFDPTKTKRVTPQRQKDYSAALSTLQSKYGLPNLSSPSTPLLPPSKKSLTSKPPSAPSKPLATMPSLPTTRAPVPANQGNDEGAKKGHSSSFWDRYRPRS